jgi:hypothetical protein
MDRKRADDRAMQLLSRFALDGKRDEYPDSTKDFLQRITQGGRCSDSRPISLPKPGPSAGAVLR